MKLLFTQGLLASLAMAWPAHVMDEMMENASPEVAARAADLVATMKPVKGAPSPDAATTVFEPKPVFDASAQFINVGKGSGHEWKAPTKNDLRGPCPGLNAFANHGFLPRNGYATATQFIQACTEVVGMGPALAAFLAVLGGGLDGDGVAWSIGGTPTKSEAGIPIGQLGNGISGSHNKYESDASPTRPDLYEYGNDYMTRVQQFQQLINMSPGGQVTLDSLTKFRAMRFSTQIAKNKDFFNGPFTGVLVQPAAYTFIYRFMANHTEADPVGYLSYDVIQSWFAISGTSGKYTVKQGWERIPDNWYRRAIIYPYTNQYFLADALNAGLNYPKFFDVGGNTGKTNTFTGVDVANLTGGAYNLQTLTQNNNFACLAYQFSTQAKPDVALGTLSSLGSALSGVTSKLNCPQLSSIDASQLQQFPGYTKSNVDYSSSNAL